MVCSMFWNVTVILPRLYQTSISPESVRTSMMVWPRKSSDSRVSFCRSFDLRSLSSSQTRTLILSDELWHSLKSNQSRSLSDRTTLFQIQLIIIDEMKAGDLFSFVTGDMDSFCEGLLTRNYVHLLKFSIVSMVTV